MRITELLSRLPGAVCRSGDWVLAVLVVAIVGLLIVPLPTALVDTLIAVNLMLSAVMLMVSLYLPRALAFSTFPSLLLLTTLFRLALNVTTTRLILLHADAGAIIGTFGEFVVGGNFAVGAVIFLIITVVQFVVISKGSERVSEVAARFTLDAMPGKQMSIDADLRSGAISMEQARERRSELAAESQLYGAMDGAMKFVKGDAIAGLVITLINLIGGFCIGVFMNGWTLGKALRVYSILTVGDGLVSQIPALLVAMTSGMIVTRVGDEKASPLGREITEQLFSQPKALLLGAAVLLALGCIPGFPKLPLFGLAAGAGLLGFADRLRQRRRSSASTSPTFTPEVGDVETPVSAASEVMAVPLLLEVAQDLRSAPAFAALPHHLRILRQHLFYLLGVPFPEVQLRLNAALPSGNYRVLIHEVPVADGVLRPGKSWVSGEETALQAEAFRVEVAPQRVLGASVLWVEPSAETALSACGRAVHPWEEALTAHLTEVLTRRAADFVSLQEARNLLDMLEQSVPEIARELQRVLPIGRLTEVFQRLVQEEISLRNLRQISQTLVEWGQKEKDPVLLVEYVRGALSRYISHKFAGGQSLLAAYVLEPALEEQIRQAVRQTSSGCYLALAPETVRKLLRQMHRTMGQNAPALQRPVVVVSVDIRRYFRKMIERDFAEIPVLSYQELSPEINIQPLGKLQPVT